MLVLHSLLCFCIFVVLVDAVRLDSHCECGLSTPAENRIVGGQDAIPHQYPWLVAIFNKHRLYCGGSLINDLYILTAGHCVKWARKTDLYIVFGLHRRHHNEGVGVPIDSVILHENFYSHKLYDENDIALIRLRKRLIYDHTRLPVCLPTPGSNYFAEYATVAGWGKLGVNEKIADVLQHTFVKILTPQQCENTTMRPYIKPNILCAYFQDTDACQGDSGGPLFFEREPGKTEQIGIVSWGIGCASINTPGIYTKITSFLEWIYANTRDAFYCMDENPLEYNYYEK